LGREAAVTGIRGRVDARIGLAFCWPAGNPAFGFITTVISPTPIALSH
jgi:hypothetical protein